MRVRAVSAPVGLFLLSAGFAALMIFYALFVTVRVVTVRVHRHRPGTLHRDASRERGLLARRPAEAGTGQGRNRPRLPRPQLCLSRLRWSARDYTHLSD